MANQTAAELRARAAQARSIAKNTHKPQTKLELEHIAAALEAEADRLDNPSLNAVPPAQRT